MKSTLAAITWGLSGLHVSSHRALFAKLSDELDNKGISSVENVMDRWISMLWKEYQDSKVGALKQAFDLFDVLKLKMAFQPGSAQQPSIRTEAEEDQYLNLASQLIVGFCIGGYVASDRRPTAWHVTFGPSDAVPPTGIEVLNYDPRFWGAPNYFLRLVDGSDPLFRQAVSNSPYWTGTHQDLMNIAGKFALGHQALPIRDAIDYVYTCISSTIKALKFSNLPQICGGPIEIAVITADRPFRWVRHKEFDAAIMDGGT